ncbi:MAG: hypothetical protein ABEI75_04580 [Halobaculum sp.]
MPDRRTVTKSVLAGGIGVLSGCTRLAASPVPVTIRMINNTESRKSARVIGRSPDGSTVFETLVGVPPDDALDGSDRPLVRLPNSFYPHEEYQIAVEVVGGRSETWDVCPERTSGGLRTIEDRWRFRIRPGGTLLTDAPTC